MQLISKNLRPHLALVVLTAALVGGTSLAQQSDNQPTNTASNTANKSTPSDASDKNARPPANITISVPAKNRTDTNSADTATDTKTDATDDNDTKTNGDASKVAVPKPQQIQQVPTTPTQATPTNSAATQGDTNKASKTQTPTIVVPQTGQPATSGATGTTQKNQDKDQKTIRPLSEAQQQALEQAKASLKAKQYAQARNQYEAIIVDNFDHPEPHFGLALALYSLNDLKGAMFEFMQFAKISPERYEGPYNLGVIATREGRYADALKLYETAVKLVEERNVSGVVRQQLLQALAVEQARAKNYTALGDTYALLHKVAPKNIVYQYRLAQARFLAQQYEEALPAAYAVLQQQPDSVEAALLLADIYAIQGLIDRAVRELDTAAKRSPTNKGKARLHLRRAELLAARGLSRDALVAVNRSIKLDDSNPVAHAQKGALLNIRENRSGAVESYRTALRLNLNNPEYRVELAALRLTLGQNKQALDDVALALKLKPEAATLARAQYVKGVALYRQGQFIPAIKSLNASQLQAPSADTAMWLGMANYAVKNYGGAASALQTALKLQGNKPSVAVRQNLAASLIALERYNEAENLLFSLTQESSKNAEAWYMLGLAQRAGGREVEARKSLKKAASLGSRRAQEALK